MQDSPVGVRFADYVSAFPSGVNVAATWSRALAQGRGAAMGAEHRDKGVDVQLGPVAGPIGRAPAGGRNWEGFSPDPVLTGTLMASTVRGIQSQGVIACSKHFVGNEQEHFRQPAQPGFSTNASISSNIDDATMHELYLWPFADAVRAGTGSIMCSYNRLNSSYACHNSHLLNGLLKSELNFQGFVMSDWTAQLTGVASTLAGLDMTMPGDTSFNSGQSFWGANLTISVLNGTVPQWRIDDAAVRIMAAYYYVGRDQHNTSVNFDSWSYDTYGPLHYVGGAEYGTGLINQHVDVRGDHAALIRQIGSASTVLLKNTNKTLPLNGKEKLTAVFGEDAAGNRNGPNGCPDRGCDNGTLAMGWGSGTSSYPYLVTPDTAIQNALLAAGASYESVTDNWALASVAKLAARATTAIVFANADSGEGFINVDGNIGDRNNLTFWNNADDVIRNVSATCNNTILVIHSVGPVLIDDYANNPNITAILWAGLPGQETGNAIADVLYGRVNPGGKLPFTMAKTHEDFGTDVLYNTSLTTGGPQTGFTEGVFIDYRHLDRVNKIPTYEFGYGLSYTSFAYSALQVTKLDAGAYVPTQGETPPAPTYGSVSNDTSQYVFPADIKRVPTYIYPWLNGTDLKNSSGDPDYGAAGAFPADAADGRPQPLHPAGGAPGGNPTLWTPLYRVEAIITNTGTVVGDEVPQLYVSLGGPYDPKVVLRGFDRLGVRPGEAVTFAAELTRRDLSNWNTTTQNWEVTSFPKTVFVGPSSRRLPLNATLS